MAKKINLSELNEDIEKMIKPKGAPLGFKLLKKKKDHKKYKVPPLEKNLALCQLFKYCAVYEKSRTIFFENIDSCVVGSYIMGFGKPPKDIKQRWVEGFEYDKKIFDKLVKKMEVIKQGKYEAAMFGPLDDFAKYKVMPDGVILMTNSTQAYLLLTGYFDATGEKTVSSFNGHAACEIVAAIEKGKSPWLTLPCGGARGIAASQDDELWVGFTPEQLEKSISRLQQVGLKYPPFVYQMITSDLNPTHPLTGLINREGPKE